MQVPAARIIALERRPRHEGREVAETAANLSRRGAKQQHIVGRIQCGARCESALDLPRAPFVFDRAQAQPKRLEGVAERVERRLHQIHVGFGVVVITGLGRPGPDRTAAGAGRADVLLAQMIVGDAQQIPLDLRADDARAAAIGQTSERLAQQLARREMKRPAVVEIFVAENPADARRPRQGAKGRGIGDEGEIGRARHLVEPHAAAARERREDARARGIECRGSDADVVAGVQRRNESRDGQRLGARIAVSVAPGEPDIAELVRLQPTLDVVGAPPLLVAPQAVLFDEGGPRAHGSTVTAVRAAVLLQRRVAQHHGRIVRNASCQCPGGRRSRSGRAGEIGVDLSSSAAGDQTGFSPRIVTRRIKRRSLALKSVRA